MNEDKANISREVLYDQIWKVPISRLASTYGVSGSYLARICRELRIPTPSRGYWARLRAGKNPPMDALPPLEAGDATMWLRSGTSARYIDNMPVPPSPRMEVPAKKQKKPSIGILTEAKSIFAKGEKKHGSLYLYPRSGKIVDLVTTFENYELSIRFAEMLFRRLDDYGYRVTIANKENNYNCINVETEEVLKPNASPFYGYPIWRPTLPTVAYLGTVALGLTIVEMTEEKKNRNYYPHTERVPTGRYRIYVYSPYRNTQVVKFWQDTKDLRLKEQLDEIISEMEIVASRIPNLITEGEKKAEEELLKREAEKIEYRHKRENRLRNQSEEESRADLEKLVLEWGRIRDSVYFLNQLNDAIKEAEPGTREYLAMRLEKARSLLCERSVIEIISKWETPEEKFEKRKADIDSE